MRQSSSLGALIIASVHFRETKETSRVAGSERSSFIFFSPYTKPFFGYFRAADGHTLFVTLLVRFLPPFLPNTPSVATITVPRPRFPGNRAQRQPDTFYRRPWNAYIVKSRIIDRHTLYQDNLQKSAAGSFDFTAQAMKSQLWRSSHTSKHSLPQNKCVIHLRLYTLR